jgi:hypothetical protein
MPSQAEIFAAHGQSLKAAIHTGIPAKVVLYEPVTNTVTCEAVVKEPLFLSDGDREYSALPTFIQVPVIWPRAGGKIVRLPIEAGDFVWLVFSEASLAEWRATGQLSEPTDARRLSIGYPYAIPGAFPDVETLSPTDALEVAAGGMIMGEDGGDQILVGGLLPGIRFGKTAVIPIALGTPTVTALTALSTWVAALQAAMAANLTPPLVATAMATATTTLVTALTTAATAVPSTLVKSE